MGVGFGVVGVCGGFLGGGFVVVVAWVMGVGGAFVVEMNKKKINR